MSDSSSSSPLHVFSERLFTALVKAMNGMRPLSWKTAAAADPAPPEGDEKFRIQLVFSGSLQGAMMLEWDSIEAIKLASRLTGMATEDLDNEGSGELLACTRTASFALSVALGAKYHAFEIEAALYTPESDVIVNSSASARFTATDEAESRASVSFFFSASLAQALEVHAAAADAAEAEAAAAEVAAQEAGPQQLGASPARPWREQVNLDLVMDVELSVTLRFGQRLLTLREVLELTSGSVVELDRQVDEPVELLLEGKVIARGEAVVIDGNYGLRVTDVPQPISANFLRN